jgi:predicted nuclease with RNAse H fold
VWLGVDVGGPRKGFDLALIDTRGVLALERRATLAATLAIVERHRPLVVGIDSPRACAPDGARLREAERELRRAVCGIRWTPDARAVHSGNAYYGWIVEGLRLYSLLAGFGVDTIEVFPTAAWTRWLGARGRRSRAAWSTDGLVRLGLAGVPDRTSQDARDALAAAVTARLHSSGATEAFGDEIVVPL